MKNAWYFFVGAGASIASGMPLWSEVAAEIKKQLPAEGDQEDFLKIAQFIIENIEKMNIRDL